MTVLMWLKFDVSELGISFTQNDDSLRQLISSISQKCHLHFANGRTITIELIKNILRGLHVTHADLNGYKRASDTNM